jgi:anti-anti-sigma factor
MQPPLPPPLLALRTLLGVTVVSLTPRQATYDNIAWLLGDQLCGLVDEDGCRRVVVDLGRVEFFCNAIVGRLLLLHRKLQQAEGQLALCRLSPTMRELLRLCHLDRIFAIYDDEEAAVQALGGDAGLKVGTVQTVSNGM